ncbi:PstC family ABC transporter permease [Sulfurospirillum sp. 1612]|uniref:PstC family ABC transporter permease n=1 Tax=Sulfurospirillum sp. 1612 TaxID=3094835 RepID=UPI002F9504F2
MSLLFYLGLVVSIITTSSFIFAILGFLIYFSLPLLDSGNFLQFFTLSWDATRGLYGLLPMIVGTIYISLLATVLAALSSFSMAALIAYFLPRKYAHKLERILTSLFGVPTVLYAFAALFLLVPLMNDYLSGRGLSLATASFVLSFVVMPTMAMILLNAMRTIPKSQIRALYFIGASTDDVFFKLVMPQIKKGIISALIFGFSRAVGDTLISLMLAGNTLQIPHHLLDSARTLTAHIALINASDYESIAFKAIFLCGLLLFLFTACIMMVLKLINVRKK